MLRPSFRSFSSFALIALVVSSFSSVLLFPLTARAAGCTITTSETIDATYMSTHASCLDGIDISGGVNITWVQNPLILNSGASVVVSADTNNFIGPLVFDSANNNNFTVSSGAMVKQMSGNVDGIQVLHANGITIDGTINADGLGCPAPSNAVDGSNGLGPDVSSGNVCTMATAGAATGTSSAPWFFGGAAHCGHGGATNFSGSFSNPNYSIYDTASTPALLGSSGGGMSGSYVGGAGGGLIKLTGVSIAINGIVKANGAQGADNSGNGAGGGSGGSIYIDASGAITGSGTISVNGADGVNYGGGGGAGYISLNYVTTLSGTLTTSAAGGVGVSGSALDDGGSCTPYTHQNSAPVPEFSTWVMLATALAGFGLMYKMMPRFGNRVA